MTSRPVILLMVAAALASGCGDNLGASGDAAPSGDDTDGPSGLPLCAELVAPVITVSAYPAQVVGTILGGGKDITVAEGVCAVEGDPAMPAFFEPIGEE